MLEQWENTLDKGKNACDLFMEISKAFHKTKDLEDRRMGIGANSLVLI